MSTENGVIDAVGRFMEVVCCDREAAIKWLGQSKGDMMAAVGRYFQAEERKWESKKRAAAEMAGGDEPTSEPRTQPPSAVAPMAKPNPKTCKEDDMATPLPWDNLSTEFAYDSVKSKLTPSNFQGPADGSTWLWFLVGDQRVVANDSSSASVHFTASKFQAGWLKTPKDTVSAKTILNREATMVKSCMDDSTNSYGKNRGGCKPGYRHRWNYADSAWVSNGQKIRTTHTTWDEEKGEDRWTVNVHMAWDGIKDSAKEEGAYLVLAEQRAEKLNKNQYQTSMKGRKWFLGPPTATQEELEAAKDAVLKQYYPTFLDAAKSKPAQKATSPSKKPKIA